MPTCYNYMQMFGQPRSKCSCKVLNKHPLSRDLARGWLKPQNEKIWGIFLLDHYISARVLDFSLLHVAKGRVHPKIRCQLIAGPM